MDGTRIPRVFPENITQKILVAVTVVIVLKNLYIFCRIYRKHPNVTETIQYNAQLISILSINTNDNHLKRDY